MGLLRFTRNDSRCLEFALGIEAESPQRGTSEDLQ
jgi:hypothetical protein